MTNEIEHPIFDPDHVERMRMLRAAPPPDEADLQERLKELGAANAELFNRNFAGSR